MRVLSLLEPRTFDELRKSVPESWIVRQVSLKEVLATLASRPGGAIVVNPADVAGDALQAIVAASRDAGARVVLYDVDSLLNARALIDFVTGAHVEVVAPLPDGSAVAIRSVIEAPSLSIPALVLRQLATKILMLPAPCASATAKLFSFAPLPGVTQFNRASGAHQTTVGRWLRGAGLACPRRLITVARVARACPAQMVTPQEPEYGMLGFGDWRKAERCTERVLNRPLGAVFCASPGEVAALLASAATVTPT